MRAVIAIAAKETKVFLTTLATYVFCSIFMLLTSFFFQRLVVDYQLKSNEFNQYAKHMVERMNINEWILAPLSQNVIIFLAF